MAPSRAQLQNMSRKPEESFKEYAQRWRELDAQVQPPLLDHELIDLFMGTLKGPYLQHMVSNTSPSFSDVVIIGEQVENCVKAGTIQGAGGPINSNSNGKKPYSGFGKKKEGETSTASIDQGRALIYLSVPPLNYPMPYVVPG